MMMMMMTTKILIVSQVVTLFETMLQGLAAGTRCKDLHKMLVPALQAAPHTTGIGYRQAGQRHYCR
jgi:hypothetical protein